MNNLTTEILIVGGGAAGMSAAVAASEKASVTVVDDNPFLGGQIWRAELGKTSSPVAAALIEAVEARKIRLVNNAQVFGSNAPNSLLAETAAGKLDLQFEKLVMATGARELFLPFPGWTLPGVYGAGGLQALVKGGLSVEGKRIVIAGTGPLLLAVAEYLRCKGATIVSILEQASSNKLNRFAFSLLRTPSKVVQAIKLRARLRNVSYSTESWVTSARIRSPHGSKGTSPHLVVTGISRSRKTESFDCDYLACGFHLIPNTELAEVLGCEMADSNVSVDEFQRTSVEHIFCAGEPTGIAGVESSLIEGRIAGLAATGEDAAARSLFRERDKAKQFGDALNRSFALRDELKTLADDQTFVCRCEDVAFGRLSTFHNFRDAKLQTRCGMGPCQGRICGAATQFLFGWEPPSVRTPIFPVKMENL